MIGGYSSWIHLLCHQWGFHQEAQPAAELGRAAPARGYGMVLAARAAKLARALGRKFLFLLSLFQVGTDTAWDRARHVSGWHHAKHLHANVSNLTKFSLSPAEFRCLGAADLSLRCSPHCQGLQLFVFCTEHLLCSVLSFGKPSEFSSCGTLFLSRLENEKHVRSGSCFDLHSNRKQ